MQITYTNDNQGCHLHEHRYMLGMLLQEFEAGEKRVLEEDLCVDGESVYERLNFPSLLYIARSILSSTIKHKTTVILYYKPSRVLAIV